MRVAAYDIGGANIKRLIADDEDELEVVSSDVFYFPFWKRRKGFGGFLRRLKAKADAVAVTMTAELCDCFATKYEGVEYITGVCDSVLGKPFYLTREGTLLRSSELDDKSRLAAINFVASIAYLEDNFDEGILLDMGSTTTDIIPFKKGEKLYAKSDFERLASSQLVYTGLLRTPVCAIASEVPYKRRKIRPASEVFAIAADVYNVLGQCEYRCETPDNRGKEAENSLSRLARQFCADVDELSEDELRRICICLRDAQVGVISQALLEVARKEKLDTVYVCGIGREVASQACARAGLEAVDLSEKTPAYENLPCLGLAWMMIKGGAIDLS